MHLATGREGFGMWFKGLKERDWTKSRMDYTSLGCCALAFVLYLNTLNSGFVYDDRRAILGNTDVSGSSAWQNAFHNDYWGTPLTDSGSHGSYRPLCVLSFRLNFLLGGYTPWGFHLINNLMHCLATGLVVKLARHFLASAWGVATTGALFAAHPIHTEAVAGIVGRADLAACIFYLLTYLTYMRHIVWRESGDPKQWLGLALTVFLSLAALLFKETAITALLVCALFDAMRGLCGFNDKQRKRSLCILAFMLGCILYWRLLLLPRPQVAFSTADNPIAKSKSLWTRFLTFLYLPVFNFKLLLNPQVLSFDWGMDAIPRIGSIRDRRNLQSLLFYTALVGLTWRSCKVLLQLRSSNQSCGPQLHTGPQYKVHQNATTHRKSRTKKKYTAHRSAKTINTMYALNAPTSATSCTVAPATQPPLPYAPPSGSLSMAKQHKHLASPFSCLCRDCKHELSAGHHTTSCRALNNNNNVLATTNEDAFGECCCHQLLSARVAGSCGGAGTISGAAGGSGSGPQHILSVALQKALATVTPRSSRSSSSCSNTTTASNKSSGSSTSSCSFASSSSSSLSSSMQFHRADQSTHDSRLMAQVPQCARNACVLLTAVAFLTLPFLPATNLFFYVGFVVAERLLYLPSVGYCLLVGFGIAKLMEPLRTAGARRRKMSLLLCVSVVLSAMSARTVYRNLDWRDEESLYRSAVQVNPPKALGNLGSVLSSQARYDEAKEVLLEAIRHRPNMADVHFNLGILQQNQENFKAAVDSFQRAIQFRPNLAVAYLNLGISLIALGKCHEAVRILQEGTKLDGSGVRDRTAHENARISSYLQLGALYVEQGKLQRALAVYREALHALPSSYYQRDVLYHRIGDVFGRLQQWDEAEKHHRAALDLQPDQVAAHLSYGITLSRNSSRAAEAELWFKRALRLAPEQASVHHHYAEFLTAQTRHEEAVSYHTRAAELAPDDYTMVVAAATALRLLDRKADAVNWYRKAVVLRPNDAHAHTNLGAILHLLGQTKHAAASYKEALRLQPGDPTTLGNLAKLGVPEVK